MIYAEERQNKIMEYLLQKGRADASELMTLLNTSRETIRRDLNKLTDDGRLVKTHGGAILPNHGLSDLDFPLVTREKSHRSEKAELCAYAASTIRDMETIFLDNSSTVAHIIKYIPRKLKLNILVYSVPLLFKLAQLNNPNWNIISLGGSLSYNTMSTGRYLTIESLKNFRPHKAFLSCHSINVELVATDSFVDDVEIKRTAILLSFETFLLADRSKIYGPGVMKIAHTTEFRHIITNNSVNPSFTSQLKAEKCSVHLAPAFIK